jgi:2-oxoglutarate dehydrogenase E1 component
MLRSKASTSTLDELTVGGFQTLIPDVRIEDAKKARRVVVCGGKVYYDLLDAVETRKIEDVALVRIEQLYPFPHHAVQEALKAYAHVQDFVWCQEEPLNQGAWYCSQHHFREVVPFGATLRYAGRPASASPAVGYMSVHQQQQQDLVNDALNVN